MIIIVVVNNSVFFRSVFNRSDTTCTVWIFRYWRFPFYWFSSIGWRKNRKFSSHNFYQEFVLNVRIYSWLLNFFLFNFHFIFICTSINHIFKLFFFGFIEIMIKLKPKKKKKLSIDFFSLCHRSRTSLPPLC